MESVLFYSFLFVLGSVIGSFLNVLIDRLPHNQSITGRSHCDTCKRSLHWYELIPVFSFIFLKGKSLCCKKKLSAYYPFIEITTGISFIASWIYVEPYIFIQPLPFLFESLFSLNISPHISYQWIDMPILYILFKICATGLICCFIVMFFADLKYYIIPDSMHIGALLFVFLIYILLQISVQLYIYKLISVLVVAFPILLLYVITKGKGMGFADVKYAGVMGFLLGAFSGFLALYIAFISGAIISIVLLVLKKRNFKSRIPFGPFLIFGTSVILLNPEFIYDTIDIVFGFHY